MSEIMASNDPLNLAVYPIDITLVAPWVLGYKKHAYWDHPRAYLDLDTALQARK